MYVNSRLNLSRKITFFVCLHVRSLRMQHTTTICVHTGCFMNSAKLNLFTVIFKPSVRVVADISKFPVNI